MGLQPFFKCEFMLLACEKHTMIYDFCNLKCYCCRVLIGLVSLLDTKCLKWLQSHWLQEKWNNLVLFYSVLWETVCRYSCRWRNTHIFFFFFLFCPFPLFKSVCHFCWLYGLKIKCLFLQLWKNKLKLRFVSTLLLFSFSDRNFLFMSVVKHFLFSTSIPTITSRSSYSQTDSWMDDWTFRVCIDQS